MAPSPERGVRQDVSGSIEAGEFMDKVRRAR